MGGGPARTLGRLKSLRGSYDAKTEALAKVTDQAALLMVQAEAEGASRLDLKEAWGTSLSQVDRLRARGRSARR